MKSPLILVAKELTSAELNLLRTLVRLSSELAGQWVLREEGDCDVLLAGDGASTAGLSHPHAARVVVPVLPRGVVAVGQALARPFRAEDFVGLLKHIAVMLDGQALAVEAAPAANGAPAAGNAAALEGKAQLKRWPPAQLLLGNRSRIQLATMLSRGARSVNELSVVSGRPVDECREFMAELNQHHLLVWQAIPEHAQPAAPGRKAPMAADTGRGLLRSIRQRLGLI